MLDNNEKVFNTTNLRANMSSINRFIEYCELKLSNDEKKQIISIFNTANTEKEKDKSIEEQLTGAERTTFLENIKSALPRIYKDFIEFFMILDIVEEKEEEKKHLPPESK